MRKPAALAMALILLTLVTLSGCATLTYFRNDTVLILPLARAKKVTGDFFGTYRMEVINLDEDRIVIRKEIPTLGSKERIKGLPPGNYRLGIAWFYLNDGRPGSPKLAKRLTTEFTIHDREITVLPFIYQYILDMETLADSNHMDFLEIPLTDEKAIQVLSELGSSPLYRNYTLSAATMENPVIQRNLEHFR